MNIRITAILLYFFIAICSFNAAAQEVTVGDTRQNLVRQDNARFISSMPASPYIISPVQLNQKGLSGMKHNIRALIAGTTRSATSTACLDSSFLKSFEITTNRSYSFHRSCTTKDGGILITGFGRDRTNPNSIIWYMLVTKFDSLGNHMWSKEIQSNVYYAIIANGIKELNDGSIILTGNHDNSFYHTTPVSYQDFFICKLTAIGDLVWLKTFHSSMFLCSTSNVYETKITDGLNGDILLGGTIFNCPFPKSLFVCRINNAGIIQWQNAYQEPSNDSFCWGIAMDGGDIMVVNKGTTGYNFQVHVDFLKLNYNTGSIMSFKAWKIDMPYPDDFNYQFTNDGKMVQLANGNWCVYGNTFGGYNYTAGIITPHYSVLEFNRNYDFINGYCILSPLVGNPSAERIKVNSNKQALYTGFGSQIYPDVDIYIGSADHDQIMNQRKREYRNQEVFYQNFEVFGDGSYAFINNLSTIGQSTFYLEYSLLHNSDTGSVCLGAATDFSFITPVQYIPYSFNWAATIPNPLFETFNQNNVSIPLFYNNPAPCSQIASCDTLKIHGVNTSCDFEQNLLFTAYRPATCGARVNWSIDTSVLQNFQLLNDTSLSLRFKKPFNGWLYSTINTTCGFQKDSIFLTISPSSVLVQLGPDTAICEANSIVLNAHSGYVSYLWNNGTTDSLLTVTSPGTYYVTVTDACNFTFTDTIHVNPAPLIPFSVGPDRVKCNSDTLHLDAPAGFLNYNWTPGYAINSLTSQHVIVQPAVDTVYYVKAEKTPGCFAYDTVRIKVNVSPPVDLGIDKALCQGDSAILDAGSGFDHYVWSNGSAVATIVVKNVGVYSVIAKTLNGCFSYDTLNITAIWPIPIVKLNKDNGLCMGSSRTLQAGNFATYLWQDGSGAASFTATTTGTYHVTVTDSHFCKGSDTVHIVNLFSTPANFLPADTSVCKYQPLNIQPINTYNSYLWSNAAVSSSVTITTPGLYWLQVTDKNFCTGRDTIEVLLKQCLIGFYMPTAFTPDNNGRNDYIKPFIGGQLVQYQFSVFNRYGQMVFTTKDFARGWDGNYRGLKQNGDAYVWVCNYQLTGEAPQTQQGSFVLVR